jgi:DNA excision repair protein ERCC-3
MKCLLVQSDMTVMLNTNDPSFDTVKDELISFCELDQSPDKIFIFKITNLSIWNAIAMGVSKDQVLDILNKYTKFPIPDQFIKNLSKWFNSYGVVDLNTFGDDLIVTTKNSEIFSKIKNSSFYKKLIEKEVSEGFVIRKHYRGEIKHALMQIDISVNDKVGFNKGNPLHFSLRQKHRTKGFDVVIRDYQEESSQAVHVAGAGVVTLPCGSGKTPTGLMLAIKNQCSTLIVTNSAASVKQWKQTLIDFTDLTEDQISCYTASNKKVAPITICTYNMIAYRKNGEFVHFNKISQEDFGLLILDEVHLMPATCFRVVASFQACKRLALTATFVREDGREKDIFTLIGPKRYDKPWKDLEARGFIAKVNLQELRVPLNENDKNRYVSSKNYQEKINIAIMSENKLKATKILLEKHKDDKVLIIGQYTDQLEDFSRILNIPVVHGGHSDKEREKYYDQMRNDEINVLIASSIANAALDIPAINVVIQISFQGGSRSEECQRVGRSSRPKEKQAFFYTIVSKDTVEEKQNFNRQQFLTNEGYKYEIKEMAVA